MVVLDHRRIPQPHAMVRPAAHADRVFLELAQSGYRLARVEQRAIGIVHRAHVFGHHRRDAGEMLDGVQGAAFGGQHGTGIALEPHQIGPRSDAFAVCDQKLYTHLRIQRAKEGFGHTETGNLYRIARIHDPRKAGPGRDHAFAGNIASAAGQPFAEVFRQRIADESVEIEAGKGECAHAESSVIASDRRSRGNPARCGLLRCCAPRNDCQGRQCTKRATTSR